MMEEEKRWKEMEDEIRRKAGEGTEEEEQEEEKEVIEVDDVGERRN